MPFVGNAAASGSEQVSNAQTTRNQALTVNGAGASDTTRPLDVTGMSRATIVVTQTTGTLGYFQLGVRTQGNTPNIWFPPQPLGALNMPVSVPVPISARSAVLRVTSGAGAGPHQFSVSVQIASAS